MAGPPCQPWSQLGLLAHKAKPSVSVGSRNHFDHYKRHRKPAECARCFWGKHGFKLAKQFVLKDALLPGCQPHAKFNLDETWVVVGRPQALTDSTKAKYVFKCSVCPDWVDQCQLIQKDSLTKHHASKSHMWKLMEKCGLARGPTGMSIAGAPTVEEFKAAWIAAGKGDQIPERDTELQENILEATLEREQEFLKTVETVCVSRDASKDGTLLVKAHACNSDCETKSFIMGVCTDKGSTGHDINRHTLKVYRDYFRKSCATEASKRQADFMDKVDATTTDVASNEQTSGRMAKDSIHKNLLAIILDRTHSSRRGASRPTQADPYYRELFNNQVRGPNSIIQKIHRSPLMKEWYTKYCKTSAHQYFVNSSSLGAAKHRHDSYSDPAVQWVMTLAAVQATAERATVHFETTDPMYRDAKAFLDDITAEQVFDMGILTDALVECQMVVRMFDEGTPNIADQIPIVRHWRHRLKYLFLDNPPGCMSSKYTYTNVAMDFLKQGPHTVMIRGKIVREYGGSETLTPSLIESSLSRMKHYFDTQDAVLAAEYPDFDLVGSFFVFKIEGQIQSGGSHALQEQDECFIEQCIERLATAFHVSAPGLRCQLYPLLSLAKEIFKQKGCTEQEAIKKAWRLRKTRGVPMNDVTKPLMRFFSWCITTSDIERDFALERRLFPHKGSCKIGARFRLMRLAAGNPSTLTLEEFEWVVGRAQELWVQQHHTGTRQLRNLDARKGTKRNVSQDQQFSKAMWKRRRTMAINEGVTSSALPSICPRFPENRGGEDATARYFNTELKFNKDKYHKKKVEAMQLGTLIMPEKSPEFIIAAEHELTKQKKGTRHGIIRKPPWQQKNQAF